MSNPKAPSLILFVVPCCTCSSGISATYHCTVLKNFGLITLLVMFCSGSAGYSIKSTDGKDCYRVYRPQPYLQVFGDTAKVIYLPDNSKAYEIRSWSGLGKADFEFTIEDG